MTENCLAKKLGLESENETTDTYGPSVEDNSNYLQFCISSFYVIFLLKTSLLPFLFLFHILGWIPKLFENNYRTTQLIFTKKDGRTVLYSSTMFSVILINSLGYHDHFQLLRRLINAFSALNIYLSTTSLSFFLSLHV